MAIELFDKNLENMLFWTEDIQDCLSSDEKEDIAGALVQLTGTVQRIDAWGKYALIKGKLHWKKLEHGQNQTKRNSRL